jgi:hypothetical protein
MIKTENKDTRPEGERTEVICKEEFLRVRLEMLI